MESLSKLRSTITQFWPPRPAFTEADVSKGSQAGRVFMVTGGNAGVGYELCKILFGTGATVYMATRSEKRAEVAIKSIKASYAEPDSMTGQLKFLYLDLSDLVSVRDAARRFAREENRLDVLWNNAGIGPNAVEDGVRTTQDLELFMGVHCVGALLLAELLLAELLLPQLRAATTPDLPSRVVWLTSILVDTSGPRDGIDFALLETGVRDQTTNYAASKAGAWMLGREFGRRHTPEGILSVVMNPGNLDAGSFKGTPRFAMFMMRMLWLQKPVFEAYTELFAGLSPEVTRDTYERYIFPWGRLVPDSSVVRQDVLKAAESEELGGLGSGKKLWEWCEVKWKLAE
ncbi:NAD(P)-binding protein [Annulohypoxylon truncatum]|uniref:NAD(P)-binding protein n=1 Tax=Annulohypoxylon truncatum TaxID=327061 RepID=UPI002008188F|nr:NAD(P)-binding protein [Annulohypoxylon truncatum]KAI1209222.1 NAD(P)-binding protein [Annulohypoxylon truncatum]